MQPRRVTVFDDAANVHAIIPIMSAALPNAKHEKLSHIAVQHQKL